MHSYAKSQFRIISPNLDNLVFHPDYPADPSDPNLRILIRIIDFVDFNPSCGF